MSEKTKSVNGPAMIIFLDEHGEVQVGTQGGAFHPQEMILMCKIIAEKLELLIFHNAMQAQVDQAKRPAGLYLPEPPKVPR